MPNKLLWSECIPETASCLSRNSRPPLAACSEVCGMGCADSLEAGPWLPAPSCVALGDSASLPLLVCQLKTMVFNSGAGCEDQVCPWKPGMEDGLGPGTCGPFSASR